MIVSIFNVLANVLSGKKMCTRCNKAIDYELGHYDVAYQWTCYECFREIAAKPHNKSISTAIPKQIIIN
jgi:hypothetical protein